MLIYKGRFKPLEMRNHNRIEFFNEIIISIITFHLIFYTDWIDNVEE